MILARQKACITFCNFGGTAFFFFFFFAFGEIITNYQPPTPRRPTTAGHNERNTNLFNVCNESTHDGNNQEFLMADV